MSNQEKHCVVVGGSHSAAQFVTSLRQMSWQGKITVISDEAFLPYQRPPLSKTFLSGEKKQQELLIRPAKTYEQHDIQFILGKKVVAIDRQKKQVELSDGQNIFYDKLMLSTGAQVRKLTIPGNTLPGVCYLRTMEDVKNISQYVQQDRQAVIVGGGYIGLETAASLRKLGMQVTVLEAMSRVLERVTSADISSFYSRVHSDEGVNIVLNTQVTAFEGEGRVQNVICQDGSTFSADLVVVGIGVIPNTQLAETAGLEVNNGIVVNEFCQTADENILAAGDCTSHYNPIYQRTIRLESVQNASDQARVAAATVCGQPKAYHALPWFWSDQYDLKLQMAGLSQGYDQVVVRGDMSHGRSFAAFYLKEDKVISVDAINRVKEFMMAKRLITLGLEVDSALLSDETIPMNSFIQ